MPGRDLVVPPQLISNVLARLLRVAVDDATFALEARFDEGGDLGEEVLALRSDLVLEVLAIEGGGEDDGGAHAKVVHHVLLDAIVGGGGEGDERDVGEVLLEAAHLLVVGTCERVCRVSESASRHREANHTEVVTPRANAMSLIDDEASELSSAEEVAKQIAEGVALDDLWVQINGQQ
jgi:hypothetical protein